MIPWCNGMVACHAEIKRFNQTIGFSCSSSLEHHIKLQVPSVALHIYNKSMHDIDS